MARPLSEDKRDAILIAAASAIAAAGTSAPTAKIAQIARVSEGTVFTYFPSKDALLNELYLSIKSSLSATMLDDYPREEDVETRCRHIWNQIISWGARNPTERLALRKLAVSERISAESRRAGLAMFREVNAVLDQTPAGRHIKQGSPSFVGAVLEALTDTTLEYLAAEPDRSECIKAAGFDIFWRGVSH